MDYLYTNDTRFAHSTSSSWYNKPTGFEWKRENFQESNFIILTNLETLNSFKEKKVFGWIIEPPEIDSFQYEYVKKNINSFEKIYTYDENLLKISDKFDFLPIGGCWIEETDWGIYDKNKVINIIASSKTQTSGHKLRHEVISNIKNIDIYGNGYNPFKNKIDVLKDYMYSITVENQKMDFLFTEKLIDCFLTGTIPIYYGCPSISKFFNTDGMLIFDSINELSEIVNMIDTEYYYSKIESIKENFELAKKYTICDNILYEKIKNELR
jgi:hypothetical protein